MHRIAINHQDDVPPKWHHKDGWPREIILSSIPIQELILLIYDVDYAHGMDAIKQLREISSYAPRLTVQTAMAIQSGSYLCVTEWEHAPDGMIITFPPETETINVPNHCNARRLR